MYATRSLVTVIVISLLQILTVSAQLATNVACVANPAIEALLRTCCTQASGQFSIFTPDGADVGNAFCTVGQPFQSCVSATAPQLCQVTLDGTNGTVIATAVGSECPFTVDDYNNGAVFFSCSTVDGSAISAVETIVASTTGGITLVPGTAAATSSRVSAVIPSSLPAPVSSALSSSGSGATLAPTSTATSAPVTTTSNAARSSFVASGWLSGVAMMMVIVRA